MSSDRVLFHNFAAGHELNLSSMEAVICKVKDVKRFARQINMPEDQIVDIFSGPTGDIYGRISSYCLEAQLSWTQIKTHLIMSHEFEAIEITDILEQYNRQGMFYVLNLLVLTA